MDIADELRRAVRELPEGEHTPGLGAIVRHVEAAIRHYERGGAAHDEDAYTDCIYRTNQVYEGSLKEAYRILSGEPPEKKALFEIEKYFDKDNKIRSRVLKQMSRYREDYRNPSTHDYRLDFDDAEALLAIVSVSAFARLLVSQVKAKIDEDAVKSDLSDSPLVSIKKKSKSVADFVRELAVGLRDFLNNSAETAALASREPLALVTAFLEKGGLNVTRNVYMESELGWIEWDMIVSNDSGFSVPIEVITSRGRFSPEIAAGRIGHVRNFATTGGFKSAILVEGAGRGTAYICNRIIDTEELTLYRVGRSIESLVPEMDSN